MAVALLGQFLCCSPKVAIAIERRVHRELAHLASGYNFGHARRKAEEASIVSDGRNATVLARTTPVDGVNLSPPVGR